MIFTQVQAEEGLPEARLFVMACRIKNHVQIGRGRSKKLAKRAAASLMVDYLKELPVETVTPQMIIEEHAEISKILENNGISEFIADDGLPDVTIYKTAERTSNSAGSSLPSLPARVEESVDVPDAAEEQNHVNEHASMDRSSSSKNPEKSGNDVTQSGDSSSKENENSDERVMSSSPVRMAQSADISDCAEAQNQLSVRTVVGSSNNQHWWALLKKPGNVANQNRGPKRRYGKRFRGPAVKKAKVPRKPTNDPVHSTPCKNVVPPLESPTNLEPNCNAPATPRLMKTFRIGEDGEVQLKEDDKGLGTDRSQTFFSTPSRTSCIDPEKNQVILADHFLMEHFYFVFKSSGTFT